MGFYVYEDGNIGALHESWRTRYERKGVRIFETYKDACVYYYGAPEREYTSIAEARTWEAEGVLPVYEKGKRVGESPKEKGIPVAGEGKMAFDEIPGARESVRKIPAAGGGVGGVSGSLLLVAAVILALWYLLLGRQRG